MNQKAFAIFVGAIMVLSAFAGFVLRGNDQGTAVVGSESTSLQTFGVQGRLVDWNFESLEDVLEMSPESTVMAYWINLSAPQNLKDSASAVLPKSLGLTYGSQLYATPIERLAEAYFNSTWIEFHWIKPFRLAYSGLVIPYEDYMMIPTSTDYVTVMGKPTLFGTQDAMRQVIDVISGGLSTNSFTLPVGEKADLQVAALGKGAAGSPLPGNYKEFYLGVTASTNVNSGFNLTAKYLQPDAGTSQKAKGVADKYGLGYSNLGSRAEILGQVKAGDLQGVLAAILGP
ncbi:MAG: hypothetical protein NTV25_01550 [Methanothrix sp.]|nr:hypothetical protein [Methanothrix sp.]